MIDARPGMSGNQAFSFIGEGTFSAVGQVRAFVEGDDVIVEVNASSATGAEMTIVVGDIAVLSGDDFIL